MCSQLSDWCLAAMDCYVDPEERKKREIDREISRAIKLEKIQRKNVRTGKLRSLVPQYLLQEPIYNLLLLGTGEAGKTTFVKQMRISNGKAFTAEERRFYRINLIQNVVDSIKLLIGGVELMEFQYDVKQLINDQEISCWYVRATPPGVWCSRWRSTSTGRTVRVCRPSWSRPSRQCGGTAQSRPATHTATTFSWWTRLSTIWIMWTGSTSLTSSHNTWWAAADSAVWCSHSLCQDIIMSRWKTVGIVEHQGAFEALEFPSFFCDCRLLFCVFLLFEGFT